MTIDEAISYEERNVEINKLIGEVSDCEPTNAIAYHRQLIEWFKELKQLSSVQPKQKTGAWRKDIDNSRRWDRVRFYCSECGSWQTYGETDYCPSCGARMIKPQESEGKNDN